MMHVRQACCSVSSVPFSLPSCLITFFTSDPNRTLLSPCIASSTCRLTDSMNTYSFTKFCPCELPRFLSLQCGLPFFLSFFLSLFLCFFVSLFATFFTSDTLQPCYHPSVFLFLYLEVERFYVHLFICKI